MSHEVPKIPVTRDQHSLILHIGKAGSWDTSVSIELMCLDEVLGVLPSHLRRLGRSTQIPLHPQITMDIFSHLAPLSFENSEGKNQGEELEGGTENSPVVNKNSCPKQTSPSALKENGARNICSSGLEASANRRSEAPEVAAPSPSSGHLPSFGRMRQPGGCGGAVVAG